jgi:hypothetical protein
LSKGGQGERSLSIDPEGGGSLDISWSTPVVNSFNLLNKRERKEMSGGKETLKGSMHSGIYITHSLIGAFNPERRSNIHNSVKREMYRGKEPQRYLPPRFHPPFRPMFVFLGK